MVSMSRSRPAKPVYLHESEEHEMKSAASLTALIIEGESLDRFRGRPQRPLHLSN